MSTALRSKAIVRRTEIGSSNNYRGTRNTPPKIVYTPQLEARAADLATLEEHLTETDSCLAVPGLDKVTIAARATDGVTGIGGGVVSGVSRSPFGEGGRRGGRGGRRNGEGVMGSGYGEECEQKKSECGEEVEENSK